MLVTAAVLGTGSSSSDHGRFCSIATCSSLLMIRVCDGMWSSMMYFHSSMKQPGGAGALHCCFSSSDSRLVVESYLKPRDALDASLHTRRVRVKSGGSATRAAEPAGIGMDEIPHNLGCHVLSHLLWWHVHSSLRLTLITYQAQQLPVRPPPLFLFAEHPCSTQAVVKFSSGS
jgi:hypothetical protein